MNEQERITSQEDMDLTFEDDNELLEIAEDEDGAGIGLLIAGVYTAGVLTAAAYNRWGKPALKKFVTRMKAKAEVSKNKNVIDVEPESVE